MRRRLPPHRAANCVTCVERVYEAKPDSVQSETAANFGICAVAFMGFGWIGDHAFQ